MNMILADACAEVMRDFTVEAADTPALIAETFRLRHQVYCVEHHFLPGDDGLETDGFDSHSVHAVLRHRASGDVIGSARLVMAERDNADACFPVQAVCSMSLHPHVAVGRTAEVSRIAISKERLKAIQRPPSLLRMALFRGVAMLSAQHSLTHWCAVMEPVLLRLLRGNGIHFAPLGGLVDYHGERQPCHASITQLFSRLRRESPEIWSFITSEGLFADVSMAA